MWVDNSAENRFPSDDSSVVGMMLAVVMGGAEYDLSLMDTSEGNFVLESHFPFALSLPLAAAPQTTSASAFISPAEFGPEVSNFGACHTY